MLLSAQHALDCTQRPHVCWVMVGTTKLEAVQGLAPRSSRGWRVFGERRRAVGLCSQKALGSFETA